MNLRKGGKTMSLLSAPDGTSYLRPFIMITSLFLLWGFAHGLLDVLDKHFQNTLHVSKAESGLIPMGCFVYIAYYAISRKRSPDEEVNQPILMHH